MLKKVNSIEEDDKQRRALKNETHVKSARGAQEVVYSLETKKVVATGCIVSPRMCCQFSWGLVPDGMLPAPISPRHQTGQFRG